MEHFALFHLHVSFIYGNIIASILLKLILELILQIISWALAKLQEKSSFNTTFLKHIEEEFTY